MTLTRRPNLPGSRGKVFVTPISPRLVVEYGLRWGSPKRPASDDITTIDAAPDIFSRGVANRVTVNVPVSWTRSTASRAAGSMPATQAVGPAMPALWTSTSRPPLASLGCRIIACTDTRSPMSQTRVVSPGIRARR